jgi:hypothetical protein
MSFMLREEYSNQQSPSKVTPICVRIHLPENLDA